jgi:hypothetical protein
MDEERNIQTWHDLLRQIIELPYERERIAHAIHVKPITLQRWVSGESRPREDNLRSLLRAIPHNYVQDFARLIAQDYPDSRLVETLQDDNIPQNPPSEFYARVLSGYADTPPSLYPHALCQLLLQQILEHFDPNRRGMAVSIVCCIASLSGNNISSLRELVGMGTPPWPRDLLRHPMLLGAESLAGAAVSQCRLVSVEGRDEGYIVPSHWTDYEQSAIAYPIKRQTRVMGCLLVASTLPHFFSKKHVALIEHYANLTAPLFQPQDFFAPENIQLRFMPPYHIQRPYFHDFAGRMTRLMVEANMNQTTLTLQKAEEQVWQSIEAELLQLSIQLWMSKLQDKEKIN